MAMPRRATASDAPRWRRARMMQAVVAQLLVLSRHAALSATRTRF